MAPAEHIERQVAGAVVIAMEEPPLLLAMHGIVGCIEIKDDHDASLGRRQRSIFHRIDRKLVECEAKVLCRLRSHDDRWTGHIEPRRWLVHERLELSEYERFNRCATPALFDQ